jgi:hypothetical protein
MPEDEETLQHDLEAQYGSLYDKPGYGM